MTIEDFIRSGQDPFQALANQRRAADAHDFELRGRRVLYCIERAEHFGGGAPLTVWAQTRYVSLDDGSEGLVRERLVVLSEADILRHATEPGERPIARSWELEEAANAAFQYGYCLKRPADPRDIAIAWVLPIARKNRLTPAWHGRRSHMLRAIADNQDYLERRIFRRPVVIDPKDAREQADTVVAFAADIWRRAVASIKGTRQGHVR